MHFFHWSRWLSDTPDFSGQASDERMLIMNLTPQQESAFREFRERVIDYLPPHMRSDFDILKWLTARNFNVDKAEQMVIKSMEWRKCWKVDSIASWTPPEVLPKFYPAGLSGCDIDGSPVWIIPYGKCDIKGLLHSCSKDDYIRYTIRILEQSTAFMRAQSERLEVPIQQQTIIFDLEDFSIGHLTWKPAMDVVLQLVQTYEANYPELLKYAFVVNAPKIFTAVMALIKPFLNETTMRKIQIYGRSGWKEKILLQVPPDQLPVHWGGTMTDPDGNPKCPSKVCVGGEVPRSFYLKKNKLNYSDRDRLKSITVPKAGKEVIELEVSKPGTELRWEFQSDDFDIAFGIMRERKSDEEEVMVAPHRVNCHLVTEEGSLICTKPGTYQFIFDNTFSYLRSKNLYYQVQLIPPDENAKS